MSIGLQILSFYLCVCVIIGNRSRVEDCRDHPYMRSSPFMHLQGQLSNGVQLLKDGRLAHGMDINGAAADPRLSAIQDMCNQGGFIGQTGLILFMRVKC